MQVPALITSPVQHTNDWTELPFSTTVFEQLCRQPTEVWSPEKVLPQVDYMARYLHLLECERLVIERTYRDRDFEADFATYFSHSIAQLAPFCARVHCFRRPTAFSDSTTLIDWMEHRVVAHLGEIDRSALETWRALSKEFSADYLGFIVIRPLASAPIGRTVLRKPEPKHESPSTRQRFHTARPHTAHLGGIPLVVEGVEFAQQDHASAACATVALWTALHAVQDPRAIPTTPADITQFASRGAIPLGRALPSVALTVSQMNEAVRALGFAPSVVHAGERAEVMLSLLTMAVTSPLPCIAIVDPLSTPQVDRHAVAILGGETDESIASDSRCDRSLALVYLHDDLLGPYAEAFVVRNDADGLAEANAEIAAEIARRRAFEPARRKKEEGDEPDIPVVRTVPPEACALMISDHGRSRRKDVYVITELLFPLPPDVFLAPSEFYRLALKLPWETMRGLYPDPTVWTVKLRPRLRSGMEYLRELALQPRLSSTQRRQIREQLAISRYVGVLHIDVAPTADRTHRLRLCDVLYDMASTEMHPRPLGVLEYAPAEPDCVDAARRAQLEQRANDAARALHAALEIDGPCTLWLRGGTPGASPPK